MWVLLQSGYIISVNSEKLVYFFAVIIRLGKAVGFVSSAEASDV